MFDLLKKGLLAGIGATVVTKETIEATLQEYVNKGKLSADEAKAVATRITDAGEQEYDRMRDQANEFYEDALRRANVVSRKEFEVLEKRIHALEEHLNALSAAETEGMPASDPAPQQ